MKTIKFSLTLLLVVSNLLFTQTVADYYPLIVGAYWIQQSDSVNGLFNPSTFRTDVEGTNLIGDETYFRISQIQSSNDGSFYSQWYIWVRENSTGAITGAFGNSDSVVVFDTPLPSFPNNALSLGYEWEYDFPGTGMGIQHWECLTESVSETVEVPAGIFYNCIKIKSIITDESGDTVQIFRQYYAEGIGQVLNEGWSWYGGNFNFELIEYSTQSTDVEDIISILPEDGFILDMNTNSPYEAIEFIIHNESDATISLNLQVESIDSTYLLYIAQPNTNNFNGNIWRMRPDGSDKTQLTFDTLDYEASWSPDASKILFYSLRSGVFDIWVMNSDGSNMTNLTNNSAADLNPNWSPDGRHIIFSSDRDDPAGEIYRMTAAGGNVQRITFNEVQDARPRYSPDGQYFVTMTKVSGSNRDILVYTADGRSNTRIDFSDIKYEFHPSWTPDGKRVVWASGNNNIGELDIVSANKDGSDYRTEYSTPENDYIPRYSPDGQFLAFSKSTFYPLGGDELFLWNKALDRLIQISDDTPNTREWDAEWSPFLNSPNWITLDYESVNLESGEDKTISVTIDISSLTSRDQTASILINNEENNNLLCVVPLNILLTSSIDEGEKAGMTISYILSQNYPNPFNPETMIKYELPEESNVKIEIFNTLGQRVDILVDAAKSAGQYEITWDAKNLPSGIYLIRLSAEGLNSNRSFAQVKKTLLVK